GISVWQVFSTGLMACGGSLSNAGEMITRINFSRKSLVIAAMGRPIISFLIQLILVEILFVVFRIVPSWGVLLFPIVVIPVVLLTLGLGLVISLLNAIVRDTGNLLSMGLTFLMYLTPVLYARPQAGMLATITRYNPMYYMIEAGRDIVLNGTIVERE